MILKGPKHLIWIFLTIAKNHLLLYGTANRGKDFPHLIYTFKRDYDNGIIIKINNSTTPTLVFI